METKTGITAAIAAAIVHAQAVARAVGKDAKNTHHGYRYASAEGIIIEAKEALVAAGLALLQLTWRLVTSDTVDEVTGEERRLPSGVLGRVVVDYLLVHKDGDTFPFSTSTPVIPDKGRPPDKAEFAALTANLGYTLRGLLLLPRDDEQASIDARDDRAYEPTTRPRQEPTPATARQESPKATEPAAAPTATEPDERATWQALAKEIERRILEITDRVVLKDEMVPEIIKRHKAGMPRDLVEWLRRDVYTKRADELEASQQKAAA